nr:EOG090X0AXR [Chydorus sphaericus]
MPRYLNQTEAIRIDEELFDSYGFGIEQLMELAGLSCASAIADYFPKTKNHKKILILCGPGNNGGDGLVCARHLKCFGFNSEIFYPKQPPKDLFLNLTKQCNMCDIPFLESCPTEDEMTSNYSLIVDALFGFSFTPPIRAQFVEIIRNIANTSTPVCSIDIPSGWDVEKGPTGSIRENVKPTILISLTAPKLCAQYFQGGHHYLGGLFIPPKMAKEYSLDLPPYPPNNFIRLN